VADEAVGAEPLSVFEFPEKQGFTGNSRVKQAIVMELCSELSTFIRYLTPKFPMPFAGNFDATTGSR
jgi:hypothetical protein